MTRKRYVKFMRAIIYAYGYGGKVERFFTDLKCDSYSTAFNRSFKYVAFSKAHGLSDCELLKGLQTRSRYLTRREGNVLPCINSFYGMIKSPISSVYGVMHNGR